MKEQEHTATARERHREPEPLHPEAVPHDRAKRQDVSDGGLSAVPLLARARSGETREAEGRYEWLLQSVPAIVCELTPDGTTVFVNEFVTAITGYQPEELLGRNWWQILYPGELLRQVDALLERLRSADVREYEMTLATREGAHRLLKWQFASQYSLDGVVESLVGYGVDITEQRRAEDELQRSVSKLKGLFEGTVEAIAMTVEIRDPYTAGHQRRVAALARSVAQELDLPSDQIEVIRLAGIVHDIGKISVPAEILSKPGRITRTEVDLIQGHPQVGYAILKTIEFPWPIAEIVLQHHERLDGSGYPLGIAAKDILLEARILGVADVVEAMASHRPYRPALGLERAVSEITKYRGILYDSAVVDACLKVVQDMSFEWE